ncbi:hypothetical protein V5O48_014081 [Marasmius crinis-equi]|uniref:Uncharacterized protein n=1 Tax=Marasmius crinis-equi TaxID=585013 RepID=A0ABR3EYE6_9AGAR
MEKRRRSSKMREPQKQVSSQNRPSPTATSESSVSPGHFTKFPLENQRRDHLSSLSESSQLEEEQTFDPPANIDEVPVLRAQLSAVMQRLAMLETQPPPDYVSAYGSDRR